MEYAIQGCSDVVIKRYKDKTPVLYLPEASLSHIHSEGEYKSSAGGKQGMDLMGWNTENSADFIIQTPSLTMQILELTAGSILLKEESLLQQIERVEIDNSNIITLERAPAKQETIKVYKLSNSGENIISSLDVVSFDDEEVTLSESQSGWILVLYEYSAMVNKVSVGEFKNQGYYIIQGMTSIYNQNTGQLEKMYFEFPKVMIIPNFNVKSLNSRNPNHLFNIRCSAIKEGNLLLNLSIEEDEDNNNNNTPEYYVAYNEGNNSEYWYLDTTGANADGGFEDGYMWAEHGASLKYRMDLDDNGIPPFINHTKYNYATIEYEATGDEGTGITFALVKGKMEYDGTQEEIIAMYPAPVSGRTTITIELFPEGIDRPEEDDITIAGYVHYNRVGIIHNIVLHSHEDYLPAFLE